MDGHCRGAEGSIADRLLNHASEFDFFQAVRLLMRVLPARAPIGGPAKPEEEVARFSSRVSLEFPASAIYDVEPTTDNYPPRMIVTFMGLMGVNGVLPIHYTEWMVLRQAAKDTAMAAFFDLFNHRWISLFYKAWEKHSLLVSYERTQLERRPVHRLCEYPFAFIGLATGNLRGRQVVKDEALLFYAGLVTQRPRSASSLRGVLRDYFALPVEIEQMLGAWYELEAHDRCYLSEPGVHNQLGVGAVAGDEVWDQQGRFTVRVGPLAYHRFCNFLPGHTASGELSQLVRFFVGSTLAFDVRLVLNRCEVPPARLGEVPPRLGWDSWLAEGPLDRDAEDAVFAEAA
jgi:type VI secretion system protein ImpH